MSRASVAAMSRLAEHKMGESLLKTRNKKPSIGMVKGIPIYISGGGVGDTGIFADLVEEMRQVDSEMKSLSDNMRNQLPAGAVTLVDKDGKPVSKSEDAFSIQVNRTFLGNNLVNFYVFSWNNFYNDWKAFYLKQSDFDEWLKRQFVFTGRNIWKDIQDYRAKLVVFNREAKAVGFNLTGPAPSPPKKSIFIEAKEALTGPTKEIWRIIKIVIYVGLAIIGVIVLTRAITLIKGSGTPTYVIGNR